MHSIKLFAEYIREGRLKFTRKLTEPITYQDPCNVSRSGGLADEARYIIGHIAEDFRETTPHGNEGYCCSGGGGAIPMGPPFKKRRREAGKVKADQIKASGAKIVICLPAAWEPPRLGMISTLSHLPSRAGSHARNSSGL